MPKVELTVPKYANYFRVIEVSTEAEKVLATGTPYYPILQIPVNITLRPIQEERTVDFILGELEGYLSLPDNERVAEFSTQPMCCQTNGKEYNFPDMLMIPVDLRRIERMEEVRRGGDIDLYLHFCGIAYTVEGTGIYPNKIIGSSPLWIHVPQSHWVQNVLPKWKYGQVKLVEMWFPEGYLGDLLAQGYSHIEEAMTHFNNGNDKEVLASIHQAFEIIAKKFGCENPDINLFDKLLQDIDNVKRYKLKHLFYDFTQYLQLGRHEFGGGPVCIERKDSEFALNSAMLILSYMSKLLTTKREGVS